MATIPGAIGVDLGDPMPEDFDAVCICTPDEQKRYLTSLFLGTGKHVLVEKPLLTGPGLESLKKQGGTVYTAYNFRWEPAVQMLISFLPLLGDLYHCKMNLSNGTAKNIRESWRDEGIPGGILGNVTSHLLDLVYYLFGKPDGQWKMVQVFRHENKNLDHAVITNGPYLLEASYVSWRNTFSIDIIGSKGSAHVTGLGKWGPTEFIWRTRNDKKPDEQAYRWELGSDPTYGPDWQEFLRMIEKGENSLERDIWMQEVIGSLT